MMYKQTYGAKILAVKAENLGSLERTELMMLDEIDM